MTASQWRAARNERALARLTRALPAIFPVPVLARALGRPLIPPTPRLAIDGYWRSHPLRADRLARALATKTGAPPNWTWRLADGRQRAGLADTFRIPPAPYREKAFQKGPGYCCVCGQPVYRFGWHADLWDAGPNPRAAWHAACVVAWDLWNGPSDYIDVLKKRQARRCAQTGARLWKTAEVDHRVPLFKVWSEHRALAWPELIAFWGVPNLQVINKDVHAAKCVAEAGYRKERRQACA